ncbi:hypothetical protein BT67DRAFT_422656 [Trichocladium antarcticum]|uniref:Uncharacterized protein n=1 Tax=Trichocladium antarcticum TaxID=1450529 RepID=A0AAN6ZDL6_9PEZI|nr:hypothetical protein BT67DRAFT_422656 [Trichocladium antarcticum]
MDMDSRAPPPHISPMAMWISKLALRIVQFALAIAIIGCVASLLHSHVWGIAVLVTILPQAAISATWSFSEAICLLVRRGHRGIHPGANVALDLLLWLAFVAGTVLLGLFGLAASVLLSKPPPRSGPTYQYDYLWYGSGKDSWVRKPNPVVGRGRALLGLGAMLTILHFTTFIIACVETSIRNRRSLQVVYVNGGYGMPGPNAHAHAQGVVYSQPQHGYAPAAPAAPGQVYMPPGHQPAGAKW